MSIEYTNIFVEPLLSIGHRKKFDSFINNQSIFLPDCIYEPHDSNFGVQQNIRMYIEYGIERKNLNDYVHVMDQNFYRKRLMFGRLKNAVAKDSNKNIVYETVYIEIIDPSDGEDYSFRYSNLNLYPCTITNMRQRFQDLNFQVNEELKPLFMRTLQNGDTLPTKFIPCAVLCYTLPGKSGLILKKIQQSKFNFSDLDFHIDRLVVEQTLDNLDAKYLIFPKLTITSVNAV